jgi:beta-phosphoglucomutase
MNDKLAVIFDMDGVLVDSYRAHLMSWQRVGVEEGRHVTEEEFAAQFGRTSREIIASAWGEGRYSDDKIARIDDRKEAAFREILAADFPAMPGVQELLDSLYRADFALAVGSSGPPENIQLVLECLGNRARWGAVVTAMDVTRGKPDPQVFLIAAERMGVSPSRCAVVEDAPAGIQAAQAAGMASVGMVSTGRSREILSTADLVVDSLGGLSPSVIRDLIVRQD